VTAILVARDGDDDGRAAVTAQTRAPDEVIVIPAGTPLDRVVSGMPGGGGDEWLWLLPADARPETDALARLLAAVEVAPSVVIAGPKLVDREDRRMLRSFGESVTRYGTTMPLADDELDQSQHDAADDVLGVVLPGMLVRRTMWDLLGGPDRGLPSLDAGLDLSIRARLAGGRVVRVAGARVAVNPGAQDFARRRPLGAAARARVRRAAQLHRRMVYAPAAAAPLHWLSLLPLAVIRSLGLLLGKRPGAIPGELAAAIGAVFDGSVPAARATVRRTRRVGWPAIAALRVPPDVVRERRASERDRDYARAGVPDLVRAGFFPGGVAVVVLAAMLGAVLAVRLIGASAVAGGGLLPLSADASALWGNLAWGDRDGAGLDGPADPFTAVLAVLGSLTWWNPSAALVALWVLAPALAALGAWWAATRLSTRTWPPVLAAALWTLAPPFLAALIDGRPAAVLLHVLLPWLLFALLEAPRSWSAAGAAGLLLAAAGATAPVLVPALLVALVLWAFAHPRAFVRLIAIPLPLLVLAAPLIAAQIARGTPLGLLAGPGAVVPNAAPPGWQLLLGSPSAGGWPQLVASLGLPDFLAAPASIALLAPLAAVALLALFLPGAVRAVPAAALAFAGLVTAVASAHLAPATVGAEAVTLWPGSGLSLYWAGLIGAVVVALGPLRRVSIIVGVAVLVSAAVAVAPSLVTLASGAGRVVAGDGRTMPAIVAAEAATDPGLGTLVLRPQADGSLAASIERGAGRMLDDTSTFAATQPAPTPAQRELADLAGNLASRGGYDPAAALDAAGIEFVVLTPADPGTGAAAVRERTAEALDAQPALVAVGDTDRGSLWRYPHHEPVEVAGGTSPLGTLTIAGQIAVFAFALLLALPTGRRRRRVNAADDPAGVDPDGYEPDVFADADGGFGGDDRG
jgi:GT2 family glycosyltransferase